MLSLFYNRNYFNYHNRPLRQVSPTLLLVWTNWMTWRWSKSVWRIGLLKSHRVQFSLRVMWRKDSSPCLCIAHLRSLVNWKLSKAQRVLSQVCCIMQVQTKRLLEMKVHFKYFISPKLRFKYHHVNILVKHAKKSKNKKWIREKLASQTATNSTGTAPLYLQGVVRAFLSKSSNETVPLHTFLKCSF